MIAWVEPHGPCSCTPEHTSRFTPAHRFPGCAPLSAAEQPHATLPAHESQGTQSNAALSCPQDTLQPGQHVTFLCHEYGSCPIHIAAPALPPQLPWGIQEEPFQERGCSQRRWTAVGTWLRGQPPPRKCKMRMLEHPTSLGNTQGTQNRGGPGHGPGGQPGPYWCSWYPFPN